MLSCAEMCPQCSSRELAAALNLTECLLLVLREWYFYSDFFCVLLKQIQSNHGRFVCTVCESAACHQGDTRLQGLFGETSFCESLPEQASCRGGL